MVRQTGLRFVALGDSTTVGIGDPVAGGTWQGWSRRLASRLAACQEVEYLSLAVTGATAASVRELQLAEAASFHPHLAAVIVGVNDTMRSAWDPPRVREDILTCVCELSRAGALVLTVRFHDHGAVLGLPGVVRRPLWRRIELVNAAYDEAHSIYGGLRVDLSADESIYRRQLWSIDRLHPSALGHEHLARTFARELAGLGYRLTVTETSAPASPGTHRVRDLAWLAAEGAPWLARRAGDLAPWAARMLAEEAKSRLAGFGRRPSPKGPGRSTGLDLPTSERTPEPLVDVASA